MKTSAWSPMTRWVRLGSRVMATVNLCFSMFFATKLLIDLWSLEHTNTQWFWVDVVGLWLMTNWMASSVLQIRYGHGLRMDQLLVQAWKSRQQQASFDQFVLIMTLGLGFLSFSFASAATVIHFYWGSALLLLSTVVAQVWFLMDWLLPIAEQNDREPQIY